MTDAPGRGSDWKLAAGMALLLVAVAVGTLWLRGGDDAVAPPDPAPVVTPPPAATEEPHTDALPDAPRADQAATLADLDRAIRSNPGAPALHRDRGLLLQRLGRHADALVDFENCRILAGGSGEFFDLAPPSQWRPDLIVEVRAAITRSREALVAGRE